MYKKLLILLLVLLVPASIALATLADGEASVLDADDTVELSDEGDDSDNSGSSDEDDDDTEEDSDDSDDMDEDEDEDDTEEDSDDSDDMDEDEDEDDTEEDSDDSDDMDEDEDEDEDEDDMEDAADKIEDAEEEIAEAEETIIEKEAEGKDVSDALVRLEGARELLADAQAEFDSGNYEGAEELAREAKHEAMYAKGKDIHSNSEESELGEDFGECIAEAVLSDEDDEEEFDECFEDFEEEVADFVESLLSEEDQAANTAIDEALTALADTVESELSNLLIALAEFNVSGVDEDDVISDIENIVESDDSLEDQVSELEDKIEEIKDESTESKFDDDVIPFRDTDDEEWFFNFVDQMESEACISGFKDEAGNELGEFRPGSEVLFGESMKFVLQCILNEDPEDISEGDFWARGYALVLQEDFSDLLSTDLLDRVENALVDDSEYTSQVTRGELIQLIVDVLDLDVESASEAPFSDVALSHINVNAINHALSLGVISGDEEAGTFRPDEVPNRAEVAKIITLAKQLF